jgi:hypothetical protein
MDRYCRTALFALALLQIGPASAEVWCQPILTRSDGLDDFAVVSSAYVRIVRPELQERVQQLLASLSVLPQSRSQVTQLLKANETIPDAQNFFLVRASAFDLSDDYVVGSNLTVYYSPSRGEVDVMDGALGDGGPAKNLALLVGLPGSASTSRQGCQVVL